MATKKGKRVDEQPRDLTRKEHRLRREDRERNRKLLLGTAVVLGLVVLVLVFGAINEFFLKPNSTVVQVGEDQIITRDYWKRLRYEENQLQNQFIQYTQLEQQFGGQGFFTAQLQQLQATLSSPFALGVDVLNRMIEERIIEQQAAERGITVSDAEVDAALREQVAAMQGLVTEPQATSTAQAAADATATAASFTPTPAPEVDAGAAVTTTEGVTATEGVTDPAPLPTRAIITDTAVQEGLATLESQLQESVDYSLAEYRQIVRTGLLAEKLQEVIAAERVEETEEQVHARHILIREITPTPTVEESASVTATAGLTDTGVVTAAATPAAADELTEAGTLPAAAAVSESESDVTATAALTETEAVTAAAAVTESESDVTATAALTETETVTAAESVTTTAEVTATETVTPPAAPERPSERTKEEALALATELRERILAGEDFATLAAQYSDDLSNAQDGGDLGWFNRGAMVGPFAEAAFSLPVGEISEPIETEFGYHIIEVLERDEARAKPADQLEQERAQAFSDWLQERVTAANVQRPADLVSLLPRDIAQGVLLPQPAAPVPTEAAAGQ